MATNTGHVMNLANSIIGVSLLAMPFCFKQCGITLAIVMLILSSIISRLACHFLVKSSMMCRRRNFEFLAFYTFGPSGKLLVELGVIGFMMGTCVAFFVVMGDLGPAIISKIFNIANSATLRTSVLISLGLLVVLPLGLLRNVESLAAISTVTIAFYILFILKIFFESAPHLTTGDWWYHVKFWQPEGVLQCVPIFAMALSCQTQLFEIYNSLPSPSTEKMDSVVRSALNLCTLVYASVGILGYIAYCKGSFTGNIMMSFTPSLSSEMFKLGFVMSIAVSFPLVIFPCRASLFSLIFKRMPIHHELTQTSSHIPDSRFKCLTVAIIFVALVTGLLIPSIELVLGFVGSTIGIAICVIFPSLSYLNLCNKNTNERVMAKITLLFGLAIMITGTFGNLFAAVEHRPVQLSPKSDSKNLPQLKLPVKIEFSTESFKKLNSKEIAGVKSLPPDKLVIKPPEIVIPELRIPENIRKEPPVPIAPVLNSDEKPKEKIQKPKEEIPKAKEENNIKMPEPELKKPFVLPVKLNETISKDAIEKEEREIMEIEKQKKTEEEQKHQELLQRLKEHSDEQKKLLREQEKILKEMKSRETQKNQKVEPVRDAKLVLEEVKTIKPEEFNSDIKKIQNMIDNLKDTKNTLEKEKIQEKSKSNSSTDKPKLVAVHPKPNIPQIPIKNEAPAKNAIVSIPLPLVKLKSQPEANKSKQEVLGRDILVNKPLEREKRDVEGETKIESDKGECEKRETAADSKLNKTELVPKISQNSSNRSTLIKNSEHLSLDLADDKKPEMTDEETGKLIPDFLISKKRDLKSIPPISNL